MKKRSYLASTHEIFDKWKDVWKQNERRLRGGTEVLSELTPFRWEKEKNGKPSESYLARQKEATYINFPDLHASIVAGHLMREAPTPRSSANSTASLDFGTLGSVELTGVSPDPAYLVYYNVDGLGKRGSQWDTWWLAVLKRAMATGHRWMFVDAPPGEAPMNVLDEINGRRPYAVEFSPLSVTNWDLENGILNFAIVTLLERNFRVNEKGEVENGGKPEKVYMLLVRRGYTAFDVGGDKFSEGGWFKFNRDGEFLRDSEGREVRGTWDSTDGLIPMFPFFCERESGSEDMPSMSRPMLTSLGQVAVSYMNLSSAADYDAWDAGSSAAYLLGVTPEEHGLVLDQQEKGSKTIGVPLVSDGEGRLMLPGLIDSAQGAVQSEVWKARLDNKWEEARVLSAMESVGAPDTSGISKEMSFSASMEPKLATLAANIEEAQTNLIYFLELRWGRPNPTGSVIWPREFNLKDIVDDIREVFSLETSSGIRNPAFAAKLLMLAIRELGLETDEQQLEEIQAGYESAAELAEERRQQEASAFSQLGFDEEF